MIDWQDKIPGYREAVEEEHAARDASFIDAPEILVGFPVASLTLRRYLSLRAMKHPLVCGGVPAPAELVAFLWFMHPTYAPAAPMPRSFARRASRMIFDGTVGAGFWGRVQARRKARATAFGMTVYAAVSRWLDRQWLDAGGSTGGNQKEYWGAGCGICYQIARETGWSEPEILDMPMPRIFQYQKIALKVADPKRPMSNRSDRIPMQWLRSQEGN